MPIKGYYGGHGEEVMAGMRKKYGARAENVFYATAKAKGQEPRERAGRAELARARGKKTSKGR